MRPTTYRPPIKIIGAEIDDENMVVNSAGELRHDYLVFIAPDSGVDENGNPYEGMGAIHAGYYCAKCFEPQEKPFPKQCYLCKFPMADKQAEFLAKGYQGNIRTGPSTSLDDEEAIMNEWAEEQRRKSRDAILRPSQILLPGKDFSI